MAATFNAAQAHTGKDRARLELGDTDVEDALLQDETYTALLANTNSFEEAVARAARAIAAAFAREVSLAAGSVKLDYQQRAASYRELAAQLEARVPGGGEPSALSQWGAPFAGGMAGPEGNYFSSRPRTSGDNPYGDGA